LSFLFMLIFANGFAQTRSIPVISDNSMMFGNDIILNNAPTENQHHVAICTAFNGWLFATYSYVNESLHEAAGALLKSVDNGYTWTVIFDELYPLDSSEFTSMDIIATGDSLSNLKVYLAAVVSNNSAGLGDGFVNRYNGVTGAYENNLIMINSSYSISLSKDGMYQAYNSNPYSLGVLYSRYSSHGDSIIFYSSSNGGLSLDNRKVVATTQTHFHKVALSYGRSPSWSSGRYFAAWEEKTGFYSNTGHIFTSHTDPDFNSPFTPPVMLDSLDPTAFNNSKNPAIACQFNSTDNDSTNLTEIVLFDKYLSSENRYNIDGFYNMKSTNSNHYYQFNLNSSSDSKQQPSINFNPYDQTFMVTYYDSTTQKLPYLLHDFNMINPDTWQVVSPGYNDSPDLTAPYPKVVLNMGQHQGANVWSGNGTGGIGVALYDAPYLPTGFLDNKNDIKIVTFPNPANSLINFAFKLTTRENIQISLICIDGRIVKIVEMLYESGFHQVKIDVSGLSAGTYIYSFKIDDCSSLGKFVIMR
jgi:hypothetical protein